MKLEYPGTMLNADVHANFTNHQYQTLDKDSGTYTTRSECSIFFEVDGPYRCMVLPSSTEEDKLLKKRYAVFNHDGSLAELKGFELKRRGELELIKAFQLQVFERFLDGANLIQCYNSVAEVANHWLDVLDTQGESLDTDELFDLISENRSMSRQLDDYGDQKGTAQTCAKRLAEFLGAEIIKDKGLNCKFIIAERPHGAPVTDRAIPTAIWKSESSVKKHFLRKWLKSPEMEDFDIRGVLDWEYYKQRLSKTIQKIITIPAALQDVPNPVPRIPHPEWLCKTVRRKNDRFQQQSLLGMFQSKKTLKAAENENSVGFENNLRDIEDTLSEGKTSHGRPVVHSRRKITVDQPNSENEEGVSDNIASSVVPSSSVAVVTPPPRVKLSSETFPTWLRGKKRLWRAARCDRRDSLRKRGAEAIVSAVSNNTIGADTQVSKKQRRPNASVMGFLRDAALVIQNEEWQVIEIRESSSSSGELIVWFMVNGKNLQRVQLTVPRVVYVNSRKELLNIASHKTFSVKKVERHLPRGKKANYLYEVSMPEWYFKKHQWESQLLSGLNEDEHQVIEGIYESTAPLIFQVLVKLGCVSRVSPTADKKVGKSMTEASFSLQELVRVDKPSLEYLHHTLSYRRIFLYEGLTPKSKTGIISLFILGGGSGDCVSSAEEAVDLTRPGKSSSARLSLSASCHFWIVKPGSSSKGQRGVSVKHCESIFSQLVSQIVAMSNQGDVSSEEYNQYSCISENSICTFDHLGFVDDDSTAFAQVNEVLTAYLQEKRGPTFLLTNCSTKPISLLRKAVPNCNEFPVVPLPKSPESLGSSLPILNWEPAAVQNCLEAFLHMGAVSFPKRVNYSRFGSIPVGNLGEDENIALYDISFARQLRKSRSLLWSSAAQGVPDFGNSISDAGEITVESSDEVATSIWGEEEAISPVVRVPGVYRMLCAEIDVHDLAIAALTDYNASSGFQVGVITNNDNKAYSTESLALGDEMACAMPFQLLQGLSSAWLKEANEHNSVVADELLHHLYRLVCAPESCLNDPALHRVLHASMRALFYKLLGELQHLGAVIVCASFGRIVIATNKTDISAAQEYTEFIISTIRKRGGGEEGLGRLALSPTKYWNHYLFIDEYNFGGMHYQIREPETDDEAQWSFEYNGVTVVPTVVSSWNVIHYLPRYL